MRAFTCPVVGRDGDPDGGLAFDLLSSAHENVVIGHASGVVTLDLAEGDWAESFAHYHIPYRTPARLRSSTASSTSATVSTEATAVQNPPTTSVG